MQGVNKVDSWAQFVNLVQDARTRNQTPAVAKNTPLAAGPAGIARRVVNRPQAGFQRSDLAQAASPVTGGASMNATKTATKALGSFFDAYA